MKKYNAFTMVELIFSIAVMSFFMIAIVFSVGKKAQQRVGEATSGRVICYKDSNNRLNKIVELDYGKSIKIDKQENVNACSYTLPANIKYYTIDVIGGGGGASGLAELPSVHTTEIAGVLSEPFSCAVSGTPTMPSYYTKLALSGTTCNTLMSSSPYFNPLLPQTDVSRVPVYRVNPEVTITNQFSDIMDDTTYNANILRNITVSVAGGRGKDGENPAMCRTTKNFAVGERVSCYSGYSAFNNYRWGDDETWISPTSGQVRINGEVLVNAQGGQFSECGNTTMFSSNPVCSAGQNVNSLSLEPTVTSNAYNYNATVISNIALSSGTVGEAGGYQRYNNIEITPKNINIRPEHIGNGGRAGSPGENGSNGGQSCFVLDERTEYCADGGAGGDRPAVQNIAPARTLINNNKIVDREHPNSTFFSFANNLVGSVSRYYTEVFFLVISVEQQQKYSGYAGTCSFSNNRLVCQNAQTSEEDSYGLGGSAAQSAVRYDYIKNFRLCNRTTGQCQSTPTHREETSFGSGANGNGGAIIISW